MMASASNERTVTDKSPDNPESNPQQVTKNRRIAQDSIKDHMSQDEMMSFIVSQLGSLQIAVQDNELKINVHEYNINKAAPCIATQ